MPFGLSVEIVSFPTAAAAHVMLRRLLHFAPGLFTILATTIERWQIWAAIRDAAMRREAVTRCRSCSFRIGVDLETYHVK